MGIVDESIEDAVSDSSIAGASRGLVASESSAYAAIPAGFPCSASPTTSPAWIYDSGRRHCGVIFFNELSLINRIGGHLTSTVFGNLTISLLGFRNAAYFGEAYQSFRPKLTTSGA